MVEALMSAGRWDEIRYGAVPSRAMMIYRNAFMKQCVGLNPVEAMEKIINSERYEAITID